MLINLIKYTQSKHQLVKQALAFLHFIAANCNRIPQFPIVREMLIS
jgi:hypothetical protein